MENTTAKPGLLTLWRHISRLPGPQEYFKLNHLLGRGPLGPDDSVPQRNAVLLHVRIDSIEHSIPIFLRHPHRLWTPTWCRVSDPLACMGDDQTGRILRYLHSNCAHVPQHFTHVLSTSGIQLLVVLGHADNDALGFDAYLDSLLSVVSTKRHLLGPGSSSTSRQADVGLRSQQHQGSTHPLRHLPQPPNWIQPSSSHTRHQPVKNCRIVGVVQLGKTNR